MATLAEQTAENRAKGPKPGQVWYNQRDPLTGRARESAPATPQGLIDAQNGVAGFYGDPSLQNQDGFLAKTMQSVGDSMPTWVPLAMAAAGGYGALGGGAAGAGAADAAGLAGATSAPVYGGTVGGWGALDAAGAGAGAAGVGAGAATAGGGALGAGADFGLGSGAIGAGSAGAAGAGTLAGDAYLPSALGSKVAAGSAGTGLFGSGISGAQAGLYGAQALGGLVGMNAADKAASAQMDAAEKANATQRYMFDTIRADNAPFRQTGLDANNKLAEMMKAGQFDKHFSTQDLANDPVYNSGLQFGLDQGTQGINRQAAAGGSFLSGATLKALTKYGNDYASTKANDAYNRFNTDNTNQYNRYAGLSGAGQQATNQTSAAGQNMANNISSNQLGAGNAQASGYMGQANALSGAIGGATNLYGQNQMLNMLQQNPYRSSYTG